MSSASRSPASGEFGFLVFRVARLWRREADSVLARHGLSEATALPLMRLARREACMRQGALAEEMGVEGPSLVRLLDLLEAEGLVERRDDPTDRRAKTLHLTAKGQNRAVEIDGVMQRLRRELLQDVSPEEIEIAVRTLRHIERRAEVLHKHEASLEAQP